MRRYTWTVGLTAATVAAAGLGLLTGCGSEPAKEQPASSSAATTTTTESPTPTLAPGEVAVSPGGVTTAVGAASESEESEYFQACHAAKVWMDAQGGDPKTLIEPYLATLQAPDAVPGPGTYDKAWGELPQPRQAAVIVAVEGAANQWCG